MGVLDKLKKNTTIDDSSPLDKSRFFTKKDMIQTSVPMVNVALSGRLDGGLVPGLTTLAGPTKHFKTSFALLMASAYQKKYPDSAILFYDSEFGTPQSYFASFGIDQTKVLHTPVTDVELLKHDIMVQLKNIEAGDRVMIVVDSIGNLASKKEVDDAEEGKSVADMTRAKQLKSLFRMVTPHLTIKDIPMVVVNHTYKEIGLYPKDIVSGGTGSQYSSDTIWIIGRQQEKVGTEIQGYHFIINIEKSRFVREKSKIPITVTFEGGIQPYSGLLDIAETGGFVEKPSVGWYSAKHYKKGAKIRADETQTTEFWAPLLANDTFKTYVQKRFEVTYGSILSSLDQEAVLEK